MYYLIELLLGKLGAAFGEKEEKKLLVLNSLAEVEKLGGKTVGRMVEERSGEEEKIEDCPLPC